MKYWFKRRRYGYGWTPVTLQGRLVLFVYFLVILSGAMSLDGAEPAGARRELSTYLLIVAIATTALLRIAYKTGPKPKWRWGAKPTDNSDEDA